ncbi:MAG: NB-ARC domain-containing protein [Lachnospiraceae bacterium]|nr:NB-ARC domain-containing protein [Lachnospiraceae bacterium]
MNQMDFAYLLFDDFMKCDESIDYEFDPGQLCRWMNGMAKMSPRVSGYYQKEAHRQALSDNIRHNILPDMYDGPMASQKIYELIIGDESISERKKTELTRSYPCSTPRDDADLIASALCFGMSREFVKRDVRTEKLLSAGELSPVLSDFIMGNDVPKPCRYFCGREKEIEQLHEMLSEHGKVFLYGIAGIGKSELAKAYARQYKKEYTNILYLIYSGDLHQDVTNLDFADDLPEDSDEERFCKHHRFMRTLKADTLLIIDNFNVTATKDSFLPVVMKYRCRVLFTTRSRLENYTTMELTEISDRAELLALMGKYYSEAAQYTAEMEQIIDTVHSHTLAVELAARLLEHGLLEPAELLRKLREDKIALDNADKISITKDGKSSKETYYGHIHTLFSLYLLSEESRQIMRNMALFPATGLPLKRVAEWLSLTDLNEVNDLIELGLIIPKPGRAASLHPMIQEIVIADEKPSITNCRTLCENLQEICLAHGADYPAYRQLFTTVENIAALAIKDDLLFYLRFLEDVFPYMEKYSYEQGMRLIIQEMKPLLEDKSAAAVNDRALFLDYEAACEKKTEKAIKLEKEALALLPEINEDNALLAANLHANLGGLYRQSRQYDLTSQHMEMGMWILEQYGFTCTHDSITQYVNYAFFLCEIKETERGMTALKRLAMIIQKCNSEQSMDYAAVQEAMGGVCLAQAKISEAKLHFQRALDIYETVWADEPELIETKRQEILELYPQAGIGIAQRLIEKK